MLVFINVIRPIYEIYAFECCCDSYIAIKIAFEMLEIIRANRDIHLAFLNLHISLLISLISLYLIKDQIDFYVSISWIKIPFPQKGY